MAIQVLSILGILILSYGFISEYRRRRQLEEEHKAITSGQK